MSKPVCPLALCARFWGNDAASARDRTVLGKLFEAACDDDLFRTNVLRLFPNDMITASQRPLYPTEYERVASLIQSGRLPDQAPLMAAVLWWTRRDGQGGPGSYFVFGDPRQLTLAHTDACDRILHAMLFAGKHCIEHLALENRRLAFTDPELFDVFPQMEVLHTIMDASPGPSTESTQRLCAALSSRRPMQLSRLGIVKLQQE
jgi:hypothetical protein